MIGNGPLWCFLAWIGAVRSNWAAELEEGGLRLPDKRGAVCVGVDYWNNRTISATPQIGLLASDRFYVAITMHNEPASCQMLQFAKLAR